MCYGVLVFIYFHKRWVWVRIGLCVVLTIIAADVVFWIYQTHFNQQLRVTYLDVGQGNAALIQFPGKERMLIDGGGFHRGTFNVGRMVVAPALWHSKICHIDYVVLSHPQSDHMNGLRFISSHFNPKEFWYNGDCVQTLSFKELMKILDSKEVKKILPFDLVHGREISGVRIKLFHPTTDRKTLFFHNNSSDLNNNSLVLQLSYKGTSFLFPGDLEFPGEAIIVDKIGPLLKSDILLVPHHGSNHSCSKPFLEMVKPDISVISSGSGNYFGFPHPETMEKLKKIGSRIIRTDTVGAVRISAGENRLEIKTFIQ
jgi:competence protein ComEC